MGIHKLWARARSYSGSQEHMYVLVNTEAYILLFVYFLAGIVASCLKFLYIVDIFAACGVGQEIGAIESIWGWYTMVYLSLYRKIDQKDH